MLIKKTVATIVTILAGIGLILTIAYFVIEINGFKGFAALYYGPAILFIAVVFAIIGTLAVREIKIFINARRAKKEKIDKTL